MSVDMTEYEMLDDVNLSIEEAHASAAHAIAGYVNGIYANWPAIVAKYGRSGKFLLSIDVQANPAVGAQALDIEKGDASIAQAPGWFKATQKAGRAAKDLRWYPKLYISESNAQALVDEMSKAGIARNEYMLWTAHYGKGKHICGPKTCGCPVQADATQWTSTFEGASLDASQCYGYFFAGPGAVVPPGSPGSTAPKLGVPEGLSASASYRGADLGWSAVSGAHEYDVQLLNGNVEAGRVKVTATHTALPVKASTAYKFRVAALPGGDWSPEYGFETPAAPKPPVPPTPPPTPGPVPPPAPKPVETLVYVQKILSVSDASKAGFPEGTIVFIPHMVQGA